MLSQLNYLTKRNLLTFVKDKKRIFFTFLSPFIVLFVFLLFVNSLIKDSVHGAPNTIKIIVDLTLVVSLISVTMFTTAISCAGVMVYDAQNKVLNDLYITPVKKGIVKLSYYVFNIIVNLIVNLSMFIVMIIYMYIHKTNYDSTNGQHVITATNIIYALLAIILGCIVNSTFFVFIISFIKNISLYSIFSSLVSSVAGFLIGAYVPLYNFPRWISEIASLLPSTQVTNLFRLSMLEHLNIINNNPQVHDTVLFAILFGIYNLKWYYQLLYASLWTVLLVALTFIIKSKKRTL